MASESLAMIVNMLRASHPAHEPTVEQMRAQLEIMVAAFAPPADATLEPVDAGGVPAEWVTTPEADGNRTILYLHGGGYVMGSISSHRDLAIRLSRAARARVLLLDYRLAPEHPHPAAVEDSTAAYRWLLAQHEFVVEQALRERLHKQRVHVGIDAAGFEQDVEAHEIGLVCIKPSGFANDQRFGGFVSRTNERCLR